MKIELEPYKDILEYIDEKSITKKPLQIDLLVIKKPSNIKIENAIGKIFRAINIVEYKSPTDYLSIDDFYKVSAYAYLLKADADTEDGIPFDDLTISLVSSKAPNLVFEHLKEEQLMNEAWMELFSPEIEAKVDKMKREIVIELNNMDITITQIAQATKLSEARVREILGKPA
ncbi:MAG: hypothetical protein LBM60_02795 [Clostridium sp.]|nr:hypothetical protein [Clostridium sp.]